MSEEIKNTENTLTKKDRVSMFLRSNFHSTWCRPSNGFITQKRNSQKH